MARLRKIRSLAHDTAANFAVEFALAAPLFVLMFIGLTDYGMAAKLRSTLDAAARSGLQVLLKNPSNTTVARDTAQAIAADATVQASHTCACNDGTAVDCSTGTCVNEAPRQYVTVSATQSYDLLFPWPGFASPLALSATAKGRIR
jgi:Flp pilus assembly protein TadG